MDTEQQVTKKQIGGKQMLAVIIYTAGILCVVYFLLKAVLGGSRVSNPDAMLPMTDFEGSMIVLGIGFLPMAASCVFLVWAFGIRKWARRFLIFLPGIVTMVPFLVCASILSVAVVKEMYVQSTGLISGKYGTADLRHVVIKDYVIEPGKSEIYEYKITVDDVENVLGTEYTDEVFDYAQGMRRMVYQDSTNSITLYFVYLYTEEGKIVNWIEMKE